jgi:hypothetical protein
LYPYPDFTGLIDRNMCVVRTIVDSNANKYGHNIGVCAQAPTNENRTIDQPALGSGSAGGSFGEASVCAISMPMDAQLDPYAYIDRLEQLVRDQIAKIDQLHSEVDGLLGWINGDADALHALQSVYNNPASSESNRIKAAAAAIAFERSQCVGSGHRARRPGRTAGPSQASYEDCQPATDRARRQRRLVSA